MICYIGRDRRNKRSQLKDIIALNLMVVTLDKTR